MTAAPSARYTRDVAGKTPRRAKRASVEPRLRDATAEDVLDVLDRTYDVEANPDIDPRWIYDTSAPGYSNAGHTFGDRLSPDDRRALLEYLKSL